MKTKTGLDVDYAKKVSKELNDLLADVQIFYSNVRGYHWNIKGKLFFLLHEKFEELYTDLAEKADEIAERILMLENVPVNAFSEYLKTSTIKESVGKDAASTTVKEVVNGLTSLMNKEREIIKMAEEGDDDTTVDLLTGYVAEQEKQIWMYSALLEE